MKILEHRIVRQEWYETEFTKTGWDSHGWVFDDGSTMNNEWIVINHIYIDKYGNPLVGLSEREVEI